MFFLLLDEESAAAGCGDKVAGDEEGLAADEDDKCWECRRLGRGDQRRNDTRW